MKEKCEVRKVENKGVKGGFSAHGKGKATWGLRKLNDNEDLDCMGC